MGSWDRPRLLDDPRGALAPALRAGMDRQRAVRWIDHAQRLGRRGRPAGAPMVVPVDNDDDRSRGRNPATGRRWGPVALAQPNGDCAREQGRRAGLRDALRAWGTTRRSPEPSPPRRQVSQQRQALRWLLDRVGEPPSDASDVALIEQLDLLDEISSPDNLERWTRLERDALAGVGGQRGERRESWPAAHRW